MAESYIWNGCGKLRDEHGHKPFGARKWRRDAILEKLIGNQAATHHLRPIDHTQTHTSLGRSLSVYSSSGASNTTRSSHSSRIVPTDTNTVTSYSYTQDAADQSLLPPGEERDPQSSFELPGLNDSSGEQSRSLMQSHETFLVDSRKACAVCNGTGFDREEPWNTVNLESNGQFKQPNHPAYSNDNFDFLLSEGDLAVANYPDGSGEFHTQDNGWVSYSDSSIPGWQ